MIKIKKINKYYNKNKQNQIHVLNDINLELPDKGMVAIFGQSGCGKTTLLNVIGGLDDVDTGSILIDNKKLSKNTDLIRNKYIGYIFQNYNLNEDMTNYENVSSSLKLCGLRDELEIKKIVDAALENVGMINYKNRYPDTLSGGEKQRIAIARAIVKNPKIILADEPTGNLDEHNTYQIMRLLKQLSNNCLVLLVTHEMDLVEHYCDKIVEIKDGVIKDYYDNPNISEFDEEDRRIIYLEDFSKKRIVSDDLNVTIYGAENHFNLEMNVLSKDGKIYLEIKNKNIKIIDESSEIQLKEKRVKEEAKLKKGFNSIPSFKEKNYGKLFTFKDSIKYGLKDIFSKRKKGRKTLKFCIVLLSIILIVTVASFSTSLKAFVETKEWCNSNVYFVSPNLKIANDLQKMKDIGVDYYKMTYYNGKEQPYENISINCGKFASYKKANYSNKVSFETVLMEEAFASKLSLVCGKNTNLQNDEVVITTRACDIFLEECPYSYLDNYEDMLGLIISTLQIDDKECKIVGVVKSNENVIFATNYLITTNFSRNVIRDYKSSFVALTNLNSPYDVDSGEIIILNKYGKFDNLDKTLGSIITFRGKKLKLKRFVEYTSTYEEYLNKEKYNLFTLEEYIKNKINNSNLNEEVINKYYYEYYLEYYYQYLSNFITDNYYTYNDHGIGYLLWLGVTYDLKPAIFKCANLSDDLYKAYLYKEQNGSYPTKDYNLDAIPNTIDNDLEHNELYLKYLDRVTLVYNYTMIFNYDDFSNVFNSYGTHEYDFQFIDVNREFYFIHVYNKNKFEKYLKSNNFKTVIMPIDIFSNAMTEFENVIPKIIMIISIIIIISMIIYFIMRSILMSKIKEIGIYRAIGVTSKNLIYRFFMETLVLMTSTFFVGYVIFSVLMVNIYRNNPLLSDIIYYPPWLAITLLIIIYIIGLAVGILPIKKLLNQTPSSILTKYDI